MTGGLFTIQELSGEERRLALGGRALPSEVGGWGSAPFGVTVKSTKTTYPGNANSTIQILGPEYEDTVIRGVWKARFLADAIEATGFPELTDGDGAVMPIQLVDAMYSIAKSGQPLRVSWGPRVREGILKSVRDNWIREQDVEWELTFEWNAEDEPVSRAAATPPSARTELREDMSRTDSAATARPAGVNNATADSVKATTSDRRRIAGQVFDVVRTIATVAPGTSPLDAIAGLAVSAQEMLDAMNVSAEQVGDRPYTELQVADDVLSVLGVEAWRRTLVAEQDRLAANLLWRAIEERKRASPSAIAIVRIPRDTTLRMLATTYYGTADDWQRIADANAIDGSMVPAGTTIVIPPRGA